MAGTIDTLTIELNASTSKLDDKIKRSKSELKTLEKQSKKSIKSLQNSFAELRDISQSANVDMEGQFRNFGIKVHATFQKLKQDLSHFGNATKKFRDSLGGKELVAEAARIGKSIDALAAHHYKWQSSISGVSSAYSRIRREQELAIAGAKKWNEAKSAVDEYRNKLIQAEKGLRGLTKGSAGWNKQVAEIQQLRNELANATKFIKSTYSPSIKEGNRLLSQGIILTQKEALEKSLVEKAQKKLNEHRRKELNLQKQSLNYERQKNTLIGKAAAKRYNAYYNSFLDANKARKESGFGAFEAVGGIAMALGSERVTQSVIENASKLQTIRAQASTWQLNALQKSQSNLLEDRLLSDNKLMSRADAKDMVLAGQTSLGEFNYDKLKAILPQLAQYAQASRALGYTEDTPANVAKNYLGVAEARQQTHDPQAMLRSFRLMWQMENVTGGKVTVKDFETILRNLGPGAGLISDEGLGRLAAFAEQIKIAGHGGGGGAGAGISTVGNLVKMLQLMSAGKPTSQGAKKMMAELQIRNDQTGELESLLDIDTQNAIQQQGNAFQISQEMSSFANIAKQVLTLPGKNDGSPDIAHAGFRNKNEMWADPVKAIAKLRPAILKYTQASVERQIQYYGRAFTEEEMLNLNKDGNIQLDEATEQKAVQTYLARTGLQHRTVAAMATFMTPSFQERSGHTLSSAQKQMDAYYLIQQELQEGNWRLSVQELQKSWERLGESLEPVVRDLAKALQLISKLIDSVSNFISDNPMLGKLMATQVALAGLLPTLTLATTGFGALFKSISRFRQAGLDRLEAIAKMGESKKKIGESLESMNKIGQTQPNVLKRIFNSDLVDQLKAQYAPSKLGATVFAALPTSIQNATKRTKKALGQTLSVVKRYVGLIGGIFLKAIPYVGLAFAAIDIGALVWDWIKDWKIGSQTLAELIEEWSDKLKGYFGFGKKNDDVTFDTSTKEGQRQKLEYDQKNLQKDKEFYKKAEASAKAQKRLNEVNFEDGEDTSFGADFANGVSGAEDAFKKLQQIGVIGQDTVYSLSALEEGLKKFKTQLDEQETTLSNTENELRKYEKTVEKLNELTAKAKASNKTVLNAIVENPIKYSTAKSKLVDGTGKREADSNFLQAFFDDIYITDEKLRTSLINSKIATVNLLNKKGQQDFTNAAIEADKSNSTEKLANDYVDFVKKFLLAGGQKLTAEDNEAVKKIILTYIERLLTGKTDDSLLGFVLRDMSGGLKLEDGQVVSKRTSNPELINKIKENEEKNQNKPAQGGMETYYVSQPVKYYNDLQAKIKESDADVASLLAGQGKQGRAYAEAQILQRWLNGQFSLSSKNPHQSPWMKTSAGGLQESNLNKDVKSEKAKGKTFNEYVDLQWQANQAELLKKAVSDLSGSLAQAVESFEFTSDLIAQGGIAKLPNSILTLDKKVAKATSGLDKGMEKFDDFQSLANLAKLANAQNELASLINQNQIETKNLKAENETAGKSTYQANLIVFERELRQARESRDAIVKFIKDTSEEILKNQKLTNEQRIQVEETTQKLLLKNQEAYEENVKAKREKFERENKTAGQALVEQWTNLSDALDNIQSEMMSGFIDMTEEMLDGNLDSWRDYAYNLLSLIRRQILQGTFAPLLSMISGTINKGIATLLDDTKEADRQDAGIQNSGNVGVGMLGNGFYSAFGGKAIQDLILSKNKSKATTGVDSNGVETSYTGSIDDGTSSLLVTTASGEEQSTWWNSFTNSFSEGFGSLWNSTKEIFSWMGDGISSLADGFMELCGSPIEWLKNAFTSAATVVVEFITALTTQNSANGIASIFSSIFGAVAGGVGAGGGGASTGLPSPTDGGMLNYSMVGPSVVYGKRFAKGGIMTSNGEVDLRKYASGGIANSPQLALFGEGSMPEAFVPLPDGRSIPVSFRNNGGVSETAGGNQISIVINVNNTSTTGSSESSSTDATQASKDASDMTKLANRIKAIVKQEIVVQSRPGGLLAQS